MAVATWRNGAVAVAKSAPLLAARVPLWHLVGWFGLHALLGVAWKGLPALGLVHGAITTALVGLVALRGNATAVAGAALYVGASQVLWRMGEANLPHMIGMYLVIGLCGVAALRRRKAPPLVAWLYLLPLLPSVWLTFTEVSDLERARQLVAFNLGGPLALFAVIWFAQTTAGVNLWRAAAAAGGPIAATSAAILTGIMKAEKIRFTTESNFATSGGYGPNQVASVLSLGLLLLAGYVWLRGRRSAKPLVWVLIAGLTVQTLLTFSRSGVAMVLGALVGMGLLLLKKKEMRVAVLASAVAAWAVADWFLVPVLDQATGGAFVQRFTDPGLSNRDVIAKSDLEIFRDNPLAGVGPGRAGELRKAHINFEAAAHTEFTRVLAEHGLLGALSLLTLIYLTVRSVRRANNAARRAWVLGMFTWAWLYFAVNAFRTVMPATTIMLALLALALQGSRRVSPPPLLRRAEAVAGGPPAGQRTLSAHRRARLRQ